MLLSVRFSKNLVSASANSKQVAGGLVQNSDSLNWTICSILLSTVFGHVSKPKMRLREVVVLYIKVHWLNNSTKQTIMRIFFFFLFVSSWVTFFFNFARPNMADPKFSMRSLQPKSVERKSEKKPKKAFRQYTLGRKRASHRR